MKRLVLSNIALALLSSSVMANAADLTTNTTVTATVQQAAGITATYTESGNIPVQTTTSTPFGKIAVSGYAGTPSNSSVVLDDARGRTGVLTFAKGDGSDNFEAKAYSNNNELATNGQMFGGSGSFLGEIILKTDGGMKLSPGTYSDDITLTIKNQ